MTIADVFHWIFETAKSVGASIGQGAVLAFFGIAFWKLFDYVLKARGDALLERERTSLQEETLRLTTELKKEADDELERLKAELGRETETYKLRLKKQEVMFSKELEAASKFMALRRTIDPKRTDPEMDWGDVQRHVAHAFSGDETKLEAYLVEYAVAMPAETFAKIQGCITEAAAKKFECEPGEYPSVSLGKAIDAWLEELAAIESDLLTVVRDR